VRSNFADPLVSQLLFLACLKGKFLYFEIKSLWVSFDFELFDSVDEILPTKNMFLAMFYQYFRKPFDIKITWINVFWEGGYGFSNNT